MASWAHLRDDAGIDLPELLETFRGLAPGAREHAVLRTVMRVLLDLPIGGVACPLMAKVRSQTTAANGSCLGSRRILLAVALAALTSSVLALTMAGAVAANVPRAAVATPTRTHGIAAVSGQCPAGVACEELGRLSRPIVGGSGGTFTALPGPLPVVEQDESPPPPSQETIQPPSTLGPESLFAGALPVGAATGASAFSASLVPKSFLSTDLGEPPAQGSPQEPTAAVGDKVVWYTGNSSVALSIDSGKKFKYFNPATFFPEGGLPFCCDQIVSYAPKAKLFVWIMQYWCGKGTSSPPSAVCFEAGTTSNRLRIAVASPAALRAHASNPGAAWHYWNLTPKAFGGRLGGPEMWFDQSKMAVNKQDVIWSVDTLRAKVSSVLMRFSLAALARRKSIRFGYITDTHQKMAVAQGLSTTTAYFLGSEGTTTERIWSWPLAAPGATLHVITHSSLPKYNAAVNGTNGKNWYSRWGTFPGSVESAALVGNTLYAAQGTGRAYCIAKCTSEKPTLGPTVFKEPAVLISKYDVSTWTTVGERWLYSSTQALTWPALQPDGAGDVGIVMRASAEGQNPQPVVAFLTPGSGNPFLSAEPEGLPQLTGDYYSLRPGRTSKSFVMTAQTVQSNNSMHWDYVEWGRGTGR